MSVKPASVWGLVLGLTLVTSAGISYGQGCPEPVGWLPYGYTDAVAVSGVTAYIGSGPALLVIDISNPAMPTMLGSVPLPGTVRGVALAGDHAWLAVGGHGLRVIDVSNPSTPLAVGFYDTPGNAYGVAVAGGYALLAQGDAGLEALTSCEGFLFQDGFETGDPSAWSLVVP